MSARGHVAAGAEAPKSLGTHKISAAEADQLRSRSIASSAFLELQKYGASLLPYDSVGDGTGDRIISARPPPPLGADDAGASLREERLEPDHTLKGLDTRHGDVMECREAVEVFTRNPKRST